MCIHADWCEQQHLNNPSASSTHSHILANEFSLAFCIKRCILRRANGAITSELPTTRKPRIQQCILNSCQSSRKRRQGTTKRRLQKLDISELCSLEVDLLNLKDRQPYCLSPNLSTPALRRLLAQQQAPLTPCATGSAAASAPVAATPPVPIPIQRALLALDSAAAPAPLLSVPAPLAISDELSGLVPAPITNPGAPILQSWSSHTSSIVTCVFCGMANVQ